MQLLISDSNCIYENLAIEDYILRHTNFLNHTLLIYVNSPSMVVGRFQNPWRECSQIVFKRHEIKLARRQSGGGTVYHDDGNINFCLFQKNKLVDKKILLNWIIDFFARRDVRIKMNDRFDLMVLFQGTEFKVSGSAYKQTKEGSFHHCTLLVDAKIDLVKNYLHHNFEFEFSSKSIPSVRSPVINLNQIKSSLTVSFLLNLMKDEFSSQLIHPSKIIGEHAQTFAFYKKMQSFDWILGETPDFVATRENINGQAEMFKVSGGKLTEASNLKCAPHLGQWFNPSLY